MYKDWRPFALHGREYRRLRHTCAHVDSGGWGKAVLLIRMVEPGMDPRELCPALLWHPVSRGNSPASEAELPDGSERLDQT